MIKKHERGRRVWYTGRHPGLNIRWTTERYVTQLNYLSLKSRKKEVRYLLAKLEDIRTILDTINEDD